MTKSCPIQDTEEFWKEAECFTFLEKIMTAARTKQKEINFNPKLKTVERDQNGLITDNESLEYKFKDNGLIDWRAMIRPEHLYPNKQWFEKEIKKYQLHLKA